jgi:hypothetical protein
VVAIRFGNEKVGGETRVRKIQSLFRFRRVFLGASTEATEVCTSEVTSPTLVVWGISEPTGVGVLLPREGYKDVI